MKSRMLANGEIGATGTGAKGWEGEENGNEVMGAVGIGGKLEGKKKGLNGGLNGTEDGAGDGGEGTGVGAGGGTGMTASMEASNSRTDLEP